MSYSLDFLYLSLSLGGWMTRNDAAQFMNVLHQESFMAHKWKHIDLITCSWVIKGWFMWFIYKEDREQQHQHQQQHLVSDLHNLSERARWCRRDVKTGCLWILDIVQYLVENTNWIAIYSSSSSSSERFDWRIWVARKRKWSTDYEPTLCQLITIQI